MQYLTQSLLDGMYNQAESWIETAVTEWQQLPQSVFTTAPVPGSWNAAQCLWHLNSYGHWYLPALEKALHAGKAVPAAAFKSGWLGDYFYRLMLTGSNRQVKKKMKAPKNHQPPGTLDAAAELSTFITQLEELQRIIDLARQKNIGKVRVPISIASFIKLKAGDVLLFYTAHMERHLQQAQRALEAALALQPGKLSKAG